ncbi:MAG: hypothetical protein NTX42_05965 [Methanothrix sp.]|nr:hypothetical protein [Methanothrix sp.]
MAAQAGPEPGKLSCEGAGGRSGLIPGRAEPGQTAFRALDFGYAGISLLLLADNYNLTTNDFTTKARRHKGRAKIFDTVILLSDPCGAVGSSARLPLDRGCIAQLPAVARGRRQWAGPGLRYRLGWLARQAIVSGGRGPGGPRARAHTKARSSDERKIVLATPFDFRFNR